MIDPGDVEQEPFTPGWVPDGWEKGEPFQMTKGLDQFWIYKNGLSESLAFFNWRLPAFYKWLEWWNDD